MKNGPEFVRYTKVRKDKEVLYRTSGRRNLSRLPEESLPLSPKATLVDGPINRLLRSKIA